MCDEKCIFLLSLVVALCGTPVAQTLAGPEKALVSQLGADFQGGAASVYGSAQHGMSAVNFVYSEPTGPQASMQASFQLTQLPSEPMYVYVHARDDDSTAICPIEIKLNGQSLFQGPSDFPSDAWQWKRYLIPGEVLKKGANELAVFNRAATGQSGMPPWFMVAAFCIASESFEPREPRTNILSDFYISLPDRVRPIPEPLPAGQSEPGFKLRGTKGWAWTADQYLTEIPVLAEYKMNFLMNCYLSMYDIEHQRFSSGTANRWWEPLSKSKKRAYEEVVRACQRHNVQWCFCMNPNLLSSRPLDYNSERDFEDLWQHYEWMQVLGVKWFCISLDDISRRIDAKGQSKLLNKLLGRLRLKDPEAELITTVPYYWGTGGNPQHKTFLEIIGRELHPDVYIFWTGDAVVGPVITSEAAEKYKNVTKHRLIIWDNYPVNDDSSTIHLGPVIGRDPDLCEIADGYMSNPLCKQNQINRIPLLTCADYAYNPWDYDPARSIGQAVVHLAGTEQQRAVLKDLVEAYPGMLIYGGGTGTNTVRERFNRLASTPHSRFVVEIYIDHFENLSVRFRKVFPDQFQPAKKTLSDDIAWMKQAFASK